MFMCTHASQRSTSRVFLNQLPTLLCFFFEKRVFPKHRASHLARLASQQGPGGLPLFPIGHGGATSTCNLLTRPEFCMGTEVHPNLGPHTCSVNTSPQNELLRPQSTFPPDVHVGTWDFCSIRGLGLPKGLLWGIQLEGRPVNMWDPLYLVWSISASPTPLL